MTTDGLSIEYENGVADVLAYLAGGSATVERDVRLQGRDSGSLRQIDVVVRGTIFGMTDSMMVVDCKRWNKKIDVGHAGAFSTLVEDVRADFGLLVTTKGHSTSASEYLANRRGMRIDVMSLSELSQWSPPGTRSVTYRVPRSHLEQASSALRRSGFRVRVTIDGRLSEDEVAVEAFRHYPDGDEPPDQYGPMAAALSSVGVIPDVLGSGVSVQGGTPGHRWLPVIVDGFDTGYKVLAADETEIAEQLTGIVAMYEAQGLDTRHVTVDVERPDGWPTPKRMFG